MENYLKNLRRTRFNRRAVHKMNRLSEKELNEWIWMHCGLTTCHTVLCLCVSERSKLCASELKSRDAYYAASNATSRRWFVYVWVSECSKLCDGEMKSRGVCHEISLYVCALTGTTISPPLRKTIVWSHVERRQASSHEVKTTVLRECNYRIEKGMNENEDKQRTATKINWKEKCGHVCFALYTWDEHFLSGMQKWFNLFKD